MMETAPLAITPGSNHVFPALAVPDTAENVLYQADINGVQLLWINAFNSSGASVDVSIKVLIKSSGLSVPIYNFSVAAGATQEKTFPGLPLLFEDEIRVQASVASVITASAILFENVSGDQS